MQIYLNLVIVELFDYFDNTHSCECNILQKDTTNFSTERREDCPLVEVPSDHGRLIDLDQLLWYVDIKDSESECGTFPRYEIKDVLEDAPVIIDEE